MMSFPLSLLQVSSDGGCAELLACEGQDKAFPCIEFDHALWFGSDEILKAVCDLTEGLGWQTMVRTIQIEEARQTSF